MLLPEEYAAEAATAQVMERLAESVVFKRPIVNMTKPTNVTTNPSNDLTLEVVCCNRFSFPAPRFLLLFWE